MAAHIASLQNRIDNPDPLGPQDIPEWKEVSDFDGYEVDVAGADVDWYLIREINEALVTVKPGPWMAISPDSHESVQDLTRKLACSLATP